MGWEQGTGEEVLAGIALCLTALEVAGDYRVDEEPREGFIRKH